MKRCFELLWLTLNIVNIDALLLLKSQINIKSKTPPLFIQGSLCHIHSSAWDHSHDELTTHIHNIYHHLHYYISCCWFNERSCHQTFILLTESQTCRAPRSRRCRCRCAARALRALETGSARPSPWCCRSLMFLRGLWVASNSFQEWVRIGFILLLCSQISRHRRNQSQHNVCVTGGSEEQSVSSRLNFSAQSAQLSLTTNPCLSVW